MDNSIDMDGPSYFHDISRDIWVCLKIGYIPNEIAI